MNVLVLSPDLERLRILAFCLESQLRVYAHHASSLDEAMECLSGDSPIDLIVAEESPAAQMLFKYLLPKSPKTPIALIAAPPTADGAPAAAVDASGLNVVARIREPDPCAALVAAVRALDARSTRPKPEAERFCRINVELLLRVTPLDGDVYVRLSTVKYVKIFNAGANFTEIDLKRIWGVKKIDFLYVERATTAAFANKLGSTLKALTAAAPEGDVDSFQTAISVAETLHELSQRVGFTPEVMDLTKTHLDFTLKAIGKSPRLNRVLTPALKRKEASIAGHSMLVANVACCIAAKLNWPSNGTFQKLIFAALLHDIALANPSHTKPKTRADLNKLRDGGNAVDANAIEQHAFVAGDIANKFTEIPSDVQPIILQHHERPDGTGFPRGLTSSAISPLAAVFIAAHELIDAYEITPDLDVEKFWQERLQLYSTGTFKKIAKAFLEPGAASGAGSGGKVA